jgi:hypothetical protein
MKDIGLNTRVVRKNDVYFSKIDDEIVLLSPEKNEYLGMNETASFIFEHLEGPKTVQELVQQAESRFEAGPNLLEDIVEVLQEFLEKGLIDIKI